MDKGESKQIKSLKENDKKEEPWWQKSIVKDSTVGLLGIGIGIVICYTWLLNQDWFVRPAIDYAVKATVAAQPTLVQIVTPTSSTIAMQINQPTTRCADYDIKIISPANGDKVQGSFTVKGTFVNKPSEGSILLLLKSPDGDFFPQEKVIVDSGEKTWQGSVNLGDYSDRNFAIIVSIMGSNGQALYNYFNKVGRETGRWPAIEGLTDDIMECDRITINH